MSLIKWEPLNDIEAIMERAAAWPLARFGSGITLHEWAPRVDISERDDTYLFQADLPGVAKQDVRVSLAGNMLTIQGERKRDSEDKQPHFHRVERSYGSFSRSFALPEDADPTHIQAQCENGELTIHIARKGGARNVEATTVPVV